MARKKSEFSSTTDNALPEHHFRITVTSTVSPSYAELVSAYDWVSSMWDESKFKLELHESLRKLKPSKGDRVVFVKKFDDAMTREKVIAWAKENGYRLAFPAEREAFSKVKPDLQREFSIVDLGSSLFIGQRWYVIGQHWYVPLLRGIEGGGRYLVDNCLVREWNTNHRFLLVRE